MSATEQDQVLAEQMRREVKGLCVDCGDPCTDSTLRIWGRRCFQCWAIVRAAAVNVLPTDPEADAYFDQLAAQEIQRRTVRPIERKP